MHEISLWAFDEEQSTLCSSCDMKYHLLLLWSKIPSFGLDWVPDTNENTLLGLSNLIFKAVR